MDARLCSLRECAAAVAKNRRPPINAIATPESLPLKPRYLDVESPEASPAKPQSRHPLHQIQTLIIPRSINPIKQIPCSLPIQRLIPRVLLLKLLPALNPIMMNGPKIMRNRSPERSRIIAMLADLACPLPRADMVHGPNIRDVGQLGEHLDVFVFAIGIVDDAAGEGFARTGGGAVIEAGAVVGDPVGGDGADGGVGFPFLEPLLEGVWGLFGVRVAHLDEFVGVEIAHPDVLGAVGDCAAFFEHVFLDILRARLTGDEIPGYGGRGDVEEVGAGFEGGFGAVVDDIEAPDAVVVVVVRKPFFDVGVWVADA